MKTHYKTLMLGLGTLLLCLNSTAFSQPVPENTKTAVIQEQWDQKKPFVQGKTVPNSLVKSEDTVFEKEIVPYQYADSLTKDGQVITKNIKPSVPEAYDDKITLKAQGVPLHVVLKSIGKAVGYNIVFGPGTDPKTNVSIDTESIEIWRALNTVLFPLSYGFRIDDKDLVILSEETRVYRVNLPPINSSINDLTSNESFVSSRNDQNNNNNQTHENNSNVNIRVGTKVVVENKLVGLSFWDDIETNLKTIITHSGKFSFNKPAGIVIVSDLPNNLDKIDAFFKEINFKISQQIQVDVKVVEVTFTDQRTLGIDWAILARNLGEINRLLFTTNFASNAFTSGDVTALTLTGSKPNSGSVDNGVNVVIKALEEYGNVEVVSQPKIALLNNTAAIIQVGTTKSFVDNTSIETTQSGIVTSMSTSQVQEGVTMRIMGNIVDDKIFLNVVPVVTTIDSIRSITSGGTTLEAPTTTTKSINTMVKIKEGETVAIGGLITSTTQDSVSGVPVLSRLPFLKNIFSTTTKKKNRSELIIFITPKKVI